MEKQIQAEVSGIKCDTEGCNFVDLTVRFEDYALWVDKPCSHCGGNLLTKGDYETVQELVRISNLINSGVIKSSQPAFTNRATIDFHLNGTDNVDVSIKLL